MTDKEWITNGEELNDKLVKINIGGQFAMKGRVTGIMFDKFLILETYSKTYYINFNSIDQLTIVDEKCIP